jgi:serine/threonine-protein kinase
MSNIDGQAMDLFGEVVGLGPEQWKARLHAACECVPELRTRVEELLVNHQEAEMISFLEPPLLPPDPPSDSLPRLFGNYELLEVVAVGGQGVVYRARQVHINKEVALKLVNPRDRGCSLRELQIAANLEHDDLVFVYHVGEHEGRLYFTMPLAEKGSLADRIDEYRLPDERATTLAGRQAVEKRKKRLAALLAKVARAVHYLHGQEIIHRDLKPSNILLDALGNPLVADFGLALRVGEGADKSHTPGYGAPEQIRGAAQKYAVDVYGLGALLFKLLTNRTPFVGTTRSEMDAHTEDEEQLAPLPSVYNPNVGTGSDLELICLKCLAKDPKSRYATAAEVADDLERIAKDEPISFRQVSWLERTLRVVVRAINHKLSIQGIARWGAIDLWDAGLNLAGNGALYALIRTDQPPALLWLTLLAFIVTWWWMFLTHFFRHDRIEPTERNLALLCAGVTLANVTLFWIYCPPFDSSRAADLLAYYPPWTVVNGLAFLIVGRLYWGRYYLVGMAHFLVAALMPLRLDLAPLVYGVFVAVCMVYGASDHLRAVGWEKAQQEGL